jgi:hypothetical protein
MYLHSPLYPLCPCMQPPSSATHTRISPLFCSQCHATYFQWKLWLIHRPVSAHSKHKRLSTSRSEFILLDPLLSSVGQGKDHAPQRLPDHTFIQKGALIQRLEFTRDQGPNIGTKCKQHGIKLPSFESPAF